MNVLDELREKVIRFSEAINPALIKVVQRNEDLIIDIQSLDQFFDKGINNDKTKILPKYAQSTVKTKKRKGLPFNRVILKDKANYEWLRLEVREDEFEITTKWDKFKYLRERYGNKLLGLTDEALEEIVIQLFIPEIQRLYEQITIT